MHYLKKKKKGTQSSRIIIYGNSDLMIITTSILMQTLKHNSNVIVEQNVKLYLSNANYRTYCTLKSKTDIVKTNKIFLREPMWFKKRRRRKILFLDLGLQLTRSISHKLNTHGSGVRYAMLTAFGLQLGNVTPLLTPNNYICLLKCLSRGRWL